MKLKKRVFFVSVTVSVCLMTLISITESTERISTANDGTESNGISNLYSVDMSSISADGRFVVFQSKSSNLVANDTNYRDDIFVRDMETGAVELASLDSNGNQANQASYEPSISANGRFVVFKSLATNLVPGDTNGVLDIFVHDRETGVTERVSVGTGGIQANAFSSSPTISANGRFVAFISAATNLVPNDTVWQDVLVHDRETGITERVSVASDGTLPNSGSGYPAISADGRFVTFATYADNLVASDNNARQDIFIHDRETRITERITVATDGTPTNANSNYSSISADGRFVAFDSASYNLVPSGIPPGEWQIYVRDRETGTTELVSVASDGTRGNDNSVRPSITADGRLVAFESKASNLVQGDTNANSDIFVRSRNSHLTWRVSLTSEGSQANSYSGYPGISDDGLFVVFCSDSSNLVLNDTNGKRDIFVHNQCTCP